MTLTRGKAEKHPLINKDNRDTQMIPQAHYDISLLREHSYYENFDLSIVLDKRKYDSNHGFQPIKDFGLGYFNYWLALGREVSDKNVLYAFSMFVYNYFTVILGIYLILVYIVFSGVGSDSHRNSRSFPHSTIVEKLQNFVKSTRLFDSMNMNIFNFHNSGVSGAKKFDSLNEYDIDSQERGSLSNNKNNYSQTSSTNLSDDLEYHHVKV